MLVVFAAFFAFFFAPQDRPTEKCSLSGSVVDSVTGAPLNKVDLRAELMDDTDSVAASTTTDAKGNFTLVDLPSGKYRLKGVRNGYLDTYYGARQARSRGTPIALESGQEMKNLLVRLHPFGVIAGTVRDADGEPLSGAFIKLFRKHYDGPGHSKIELVVDDAKTDDLGQYRIADLEPGKYFIDAAPKNEGNAYGFRSPENHSVKSDELPTALLPTMYPGVTDPAAARTVEVGSGARLTGIDVTLVRGRVFRVSGRVSAAEGLEVSNLWLYPAVYPAIGFDNLSLSFATETKNRTGDFEFRGVPEGSYTLAARGDPHQYMARIPLAVDHDIEGVRMAVTSGTEVVGHISIDGGDKTKLAGSPVHFYSSDGNGGVNPPLLREDNTFNVHLYPDHYNVSLDLSTLVIKSMRAEQADVYQDGLTASPGGKTSLEIVLAPEGARVDGAVYDHDDKPVAGATVVLIAESKLRSRSDSFREYATDQYGRYHFENIRPGEYKLFAWDDPEPNAWFDPEFLRSFEEQGERITVQPTSHVVSKLRVIPTGN